jgi:hypothetical protein
MSRTPKYPRDCRLQRESHPPSRLALFRVRSLAEVVSERRSTIAEPSISKTKKRGQTDDSLRVNQKAGTPLILALQPLESI